MNNAYRPLKTLTAATLLLGIALAPTFAYAADKPILIAAKPETTAAPSAESGLSQSTNLTAAISSYKGRPDPTTWQGVWKELRDYLSAPAVMKASVGSILHANPILTEVGAKIVDAGSGARVWAFPKITEAQAVLVQYQCPTGPAIKKVVGSGRNRKTVVEAAPSVSRLQLVALPATVSLKDAQIVRSTQKAVKVDLRDLVLVGTDRTGGAMWVGAYKLNEGGLTEDVGAMSALPPTLVQNMSGTPGFSGNDLVFSLPGAGSGPQSGYKIVLKFIDGKFGVEGQASDQGPSMAAMQFMQAIQQNRLDVAKAWLVDPKLINIPKYAGLIGRPADKPFKVIAMSAPFLVGARFRVMTFDKNDLILDVAKVKNQWTIKSIYIAPPDPVAQKLVGSASSLPARPNLQ